MKPLLTVLSNTPQRQPVDECSRMRMLVNEAYEARTIVHLIRLRTDSPLLDALAMRMRNRCDRREEKLAHVRILMLAED